MSNSSQRFQQVAIPELEGCDHDATSQRNTLQTSKELWEAELSTAKHEFKKAQRSKDHMFRKAAQEKVWQIEAHSIGHYDFAIHDTIDVALLFVPDSSAKRFHREWESQDATNLLNVVEAFKLDMPLVAFAVHDGRDGPKSMQAPLATYVRTHVRNWWAHQMDMDAKTFKKQMDAVVTLAGIMASLDGGVKAESGNWVKVQEMMSCWAQDT